MIEMHEDGGDDLRMLVLIRSATVGASIHLRPSMPAVSPPLQDARDEVEALSSPSALVSTERT